MSATTPRTLATPRTPLSTPRRKVRAESLKKLERWTAAANLAAASHRIRGEDDEAEDERKRMLLQMLDADIKNEVKTTRREKREANKAVLQRLQDESARIAACKAHEKKMQELVEATVPAESKRANHQARRAADLAALGYRATDRGANAPTPSYHTLLYNEGMISKVERDHWRDEALSVLTAQQLAVCTFTPRLNEHSRSLASAASNSNIRSTGRQSERRLAEVRVCPTQQSRHSSSAQNATVSCAFQTLAEQRQRRQERVATQTGKMVAAADESDGARGGNARQVQPGTHQQPESKRNDGSSGNSAQLLHECTEGCSSISSKGGGSGLTAKRGVNWWEKW